MVFTSTTKLSSSTLRIKPSAVTPRSTGSLLPSTNTANLVDLLPLASKTVVLARVTSSTTPLVALPGGETTLYLFAAIVRELEPLFMVFLLLLCHILSLLAPLFILSRITPTRYMPISMGHNACLQFSLSKVSRIPHNYGWST